MTVLLHISDTHFGTETKPVVDAVVALATQARPDLVVLSGDITQRAKPEEFRAAKAFTERLGAPLLAIPGNHDIALFNLWERLVRPYARYTAAFGSTLEPVHQTDQLLVIGVNTTRRWRHKNGDVSSAQVERVSAQLRAAAPDQLRVVVVHQPAAVLHPRDNRDLLRGHNAALAAWTAAGADVVLGGHIHLPYTVAVEHSVRTLWVVQAGTAVSDRTRAGIANSVNLVRWSGLAACNGVSSAQALRGTCLVERWDFEAQTQAFVRAGITVLKPACA